MADSYSVHVPKGVLTGDCRKKDLFVSAILSTKKLANFWEACISNEVFCIWKIKLLRQAAIEKKKTKRECRKLPFFCYFDFAVIQAIEIDPYRDSKV